jgi:hypothetical protein
MTLIIITIPLMVLTVAIAVVPLIVMSRVDHRLRQAEANGPKRDVSGEAARVDEQSLPLAA